MDKYYVARITRNWELHFLFLPYRDLVVTRLCVSQGGNRSARGKPPTFSESLATFSLSSQRLDTTSNQLQSLRLPGYRADLSIEVLDLEILAEQCGNG